MQECNYLNRSLHSFFSLDNPFFSIYNLNTHQYDNHGNCTRYGTTNYVWTRGRLLQSAGTTTFEYDYTGKRTKKNSIVYAYAGDRLIYEKRPTGKIYYFYDAKGIAGFRYNNANYQYVKNALGDVVGIVHNGQLVAHYTYDAWGTCTVLKDSAIAQLNPTWSFISDISGEITMVVPSDISAGI